MIYSSFQSEHLSIEGIKALGVKHLKYLLDYAERGTIALAGETSGSVGGYESPFEEAVAEALRERGWHVVPQVGVSGFRVDLGIVHPEKPGVFLAGIECDGATYHRSATARDRDKVREQILRNLGWEIVRIWSPDWWYDPKGVSERVHGALTELLEQNRLVCAHSREADGELPASPPEMEEKNPIERQIITENSRNPPSEHSEQWQVNPGAFFDDSYSDTLQAIVQDVLKREAPMRDDLLVKFIARLHGFARTGAKIRERILALVDLVNTTEESTGRFLWSSRCVEDVIRFRYPEPGKNSRSVDEVPMAELRGLIRENNPLLDVSDPAVAYARIMGIHRLTNSSRERIEEAIHFVKTREMETAGRSH